MHLLDSSTAAPALTHTDANADPDADTENDAAKNLVLGHTSLLTALLLSPDERFVLTADRDEHIRVSWFPQGYVIERYCMGHKK
jgi:tRNA (guanine-N(7)-)-methyltransferase subunit TRM82